MHQLQSIDGPWERPMDLSVGGSGQIRHPQLGACSFRELECRLWHAAEGEWTSPFILAHNFELLNQSRTAADPIVDAPFYRLHWFLTRNTDAFEKMGFQELSLAAPIALPEPLKANPRPTVEHCLEQAWRRRYR
jgi:hypothetical protein